MKMDYIVQITAVNKLTDQKVMFPVECRNVFGEHGAIVICELYSKKYIEDNYGPGKWQVTAEVIKPLLSVDPSNRTSSDIYHDVS